ncbi:GXWXG domain-containing protein [Streptomyces sp. NPDC057565]|uniref:GXWXG domain-containing protein n=1 Tax=Streptomyces sp. NPDC057565 TaxID=3346169 RepID=UPI0036850129
MVDVSSILCFLWGFAFPAGLPAEQVLAGSRWHGKRFVALDDSKPLICQADDSSLS